MSRFIKLFFINSKLSKLCHHPPPSTTIHHYPSPPITSQNISQNSQENTWQVNQTEQVELNRIILTNVVISIEAVANTCSVKKMLLVISQNSQENTCDRVSCLIKLQASGFSYRTLTFQFWLLQLFFYNNFFRSLFEKTAWKI